MAGRGRERAGAGPWSGEQAGMGAGSSERRAGRGREVPAAQVPRECVFGWSSRHVSRDIMLLPPRGRRCERGRRKSWAQGPADVRGSSEVRRGREGLGPIFRMSFETGLVPAWRGTRNAAADARRGGQAASEICKGAARECGARRIVGRRFAGRPVAATDAGRLARPARAPHGSALRPEGRGELEGGRLARFARGAGLRRVRAAPGCRAGPRPPAAATRGRSS